MPDFNSLGKIFVYIGILMLIIGGVILAGGRFLNLGRLPGDIFIQKGNFSFYFPVVTMVVVSIVLSTILNIFLKK